MLGAFGNGDRRAVGIVVRIRRIEVIGLNAFHACGDGNINRARHNSRIDTDRLRTVKRLCSDSAAVDVHGDIIGGNAGHKADCGLTVFYRNDQCARTAALTVYIKG